MRSMSTPWSPTVQDEPSDAGDTTPLDLDLDLDLDAPPPVASAPKLPADVMVRTQPLASTRTHTHLARRVLVVSADPEERIYLRARLALAHLVWVEEAGTTTQARAAMESHPYLLGLFNVDDTVVDGWTLLREFRERNPRAKAWATLSQRPRPGGLQAWRRWQKTSVEDKTRMAGFDLVLSKPLEPRLLSHSLAGFVQNL
jgi:CheY-like chemotaxis protein